MAEGSIDSSETAEGKGSDGINPTEISAEIPDFQNGNIVSSETPEGKGLDGINSTEISVEKSNFPNGSINLSEIPEGKGLDGINPAEMSAEKPNSLDNECSLSSDHLKTSVNSSVYEDSPRRKSTGKLSSRSAPRDVLPNYLRASTGSCHDVCKYGRKHEFEVKERRPLSRRVKEPSSERQSPTRDVSPLVRKKLSAINQKPSSIAKTRLSEPPEIIIKEVQLPFEKDGNSRNHDSSSNKKMTNYNGKANKSPVKRSPPLLPEPAEAKQLLQEKTSGSMNESGRRNDKPMKQAGLSEPLEVQPSSPSGSMNKSRGRNDKPMKQAGLSEPIEVKPFSPSGSLNKSRGRNEKSMSPLSAELSKFVVTEPSNSTEASGSRNGSNSRNRESKGGKKSMVSKAALHRVPKSRTAPSSPEPAIDKTVVSNLNIIKTGNNRVSSKLPKSVVTKLSSSIDGSGCLDRSSGGNSKVGEKFTVPNVSLKKVPEPQNAPLSPKLALNKIVRTSSRIRKIATTKKQTPPEWGQNRLRKSKIKKSDDDVVPEKTLHVVSEENGSTSLGSVTPDGGTALNSPSRSLTLSKTSSGSRFSPSSAREGEDATKGVSPTGSDIMTRRKGRSLLSEAKDRSPVKLKFKRGKVVEVQHVHSTPIRLKFRQGGLLSRKRDGKIDLKRRNSKKVEEDNDSGNGSNPTSEKVALRHHQEVEGKKDAQSLLNNVIEETASKLVESKKSKVKALVGAFETVISLQDKKPPSQTAA